MKSKTLLTIGAAALTLATALPAAAQTKTVTKQPQVAGRQVIALQARVESIDTRGRRTGNRAGEMYGVKPAEAIPIRTGERIRVELVGTSLVNGRGVEAPIGANFSLSAGRDNLSIVQTGSNWVVVEARGRGADKTAQLAYTVNGNYDLKPGLAQGYLTFNIDSNGLGSGTIGQPVVQDRDRWRRSQDLAGLLYQSILGRNLSGTYAQDDVEHIYYLGTRGVQEVARELARDADNGSRWTQDQAVDMVGDLYRNLLRRQGSDEQLWSEDNGFRTNVQNLQRNGLERLVQTIVESPEFRSNQSLDGFDSVALQQRYDGQWRGYDRTARRY
jgi:hypothetical protein